MTTNARVGGVDESLIVDVVHATKLDTEVELYIVGVAIVSGKREF